MGSLNDFVVALKNVSSQLGSVFINFRLLTKNIIDGYLLIFTQINKTIFFYLRSPYV